MIRELKAYEFLMVSKKTGLVKIKKTFYGRDGENMTALSNAIMAAKKWGKENGFVIKDM